MGNSEGSPVAGGWTPAGRTERLYDAAKRVLRPDGCGQKRRRKGEYEAPGEPASRSRAAQCAGRPERCLSSSALTLDSRVIVRLEGLARNTHRNRGGWNDRPPQTGHPVADGRAPLGRVEGDCHTRCRAYGKIKELNVSAPNKQSFFILIELS